MGGIFDFFTGGDSTPTASSDATGSYLGNLVDPTTTPQYLKARQQEAALGFFAGLAAGSGPSRLPVPFGTAIASGSQGLMSALNNLSDNSLKSAQTGNQIVDTKLKSANINLVNLQGAGLLQKMNFIQSEMNPGAGGLGTTPGAAGAAANTAKNLGYSAQTADTSMEPEQRALLDTIAGPESAGSYQVRYGGPKGQQFFNDLSAHPGIYEEGPAGPSSAAGRYQFVKSTWDPIASQLGLKDFSPMSQDKAGWANASTEYERATGRDLLADLKAGRTQDVGKALRGQWATLAGAMPNYQANLAKYNSPAVANAAPGTVTIAANNGSSTAPDAAARSALPPGVKINSKGVAYSTEPTGGVPAGTPGAGPQITQADAARMNAEARAQAMGPTQIGAAGEYGAGQTPRMPMPIMPTDATFGRGMVAPPGAGSVTPTPPGLMAMAAPQMPVQPPQAGPAGLMAAAANGPPQAPQMAPQAPQQMAQVQPPQVMMPPQQQMPQQAPQQQPAQQQMPLPPGVTPQAIQDASRRVRVYNLLGLTPPPDLVKMSTYSLEAALAAQNEYAKQQAETTFAGPKAGNVAAAQAPFDMVDAVVNGVQVKMPKDQYIKLMQGYGQQPQGGAPGQQAGGNPAIGTPYINPLYQKGVEGVVSSDNDRIAKVMVPAADAASQNREVATLIQDLAPRVATGWGSETKQEAARVLTALGADPKGIERFLAVDPSSADVLQKMFLQQSAGAVRLMGAREPGSVISLFGKAYPGLQTQPGAIKLMESVFLMQAQRSQDMLAQAQAHQNEQLVNLQNNRPYTPLANMETQFNSGPHSSVYYLKAAEVMSGDPVIAAKAWSGLSKDQVNAVANLIPQGASIIRPDGQSVVK